MMVGRRSLEQLFQTGSSRSVQSRTWEFSPKLIWPQRGVARASTHFWLQRWFSPVRPPQVNQTAWLHPHTHTLWSHLTPDAFHRPSRSHTSPLFHPFHCSGLLTPSKEIQEITNKNSICGCSQTSEKVNGARGVQRLAPPLLEMTSFRTERLNIRVAHGSKAAIRLCLLNVEWKRRQVWAAASRDASSTTATAKTAQLQSDMTRTWATGGEEVSAQGWRLRVFAGLHCWHLMAANTRAENKGGICIISPSKRPVFLIIAQLLLLVSLTHD